ncbi:phosphatidylcholine/phosphatidylserine synthase [Enterovirga sp.]|jgi:CDP-diacylglycerol--serine O-phosphatidyltransferase|uniref:CDP-alcohol phosphatidyltransferase family protein n=1 Tax=Enterovirga sp. TaxID=2026350 RepID=UPI002610A03C|nr:phosphatidylcholine/phosphatidylserine synthase [Enterovirga sp.]MDB5591705.1 CDP-diacylglycerol--serine O-phosphatidyltransferase [Enterovirga sp.]
MSDLFQPYAPDPLEHRRRRFKPVPFRVIAPNLITLLALCLGLTAIRLAYEGKLEPAVFAILVAAVLDGVDGRVARFLKGTSRFGAELDSLSDFLNFGVAPALVLHNFVLHEVHALGWVVAMILAIAAALRLARFNAALDDPDTPEWKKDFFVGMPAPAGAVTVLLPVYLHFLGVPVQAAAPVALAYVLGIALMMVSTVPTFSGKTWGKRVPRDWVLPLFVLTVALFGIVVAFPFASLAAISVVYLAAVPISVSRYRQLRRSHALGSSDLPPAEPPDPAAGRS